MSVVAKLLAIKSELGAIGADSQNTGQGYAFRSYKAILDVLKPLTDKHRVIFYGRLTNAGYENTTVTTKTKNKDGSEIEKVRIDRTTRISYEFIFTDGAESLVVGPYAGEGMDTGDKATAKATTAAMKSCLNQLFCIPFNDDDGDFESPGEPPKMASDDDEIISHIKRLGWKKDETISAIKTAYDVEKISALTPTQKQTFLTALRGMKCTQ